MKPQVRWQLMVETLRELPQYWKTFVRSALIGSWMGIKPGGATAASFMSYGIARKLSKTPEKFGTGVLEGVVAPETANNAAGVSALLPMITLGIPGSPTAAVMLGGLLIWGLQPGPMLFQERPDFVWGLIASMYSGNVIGVLIVLLFVPAFAAILRLPFAILIPLIVYVCAIGAYAVNNSTTDIWYMLIFGIAGYVFKKLDYPIAPLVLALVLGDMAESALRQSLIMSQGSPMIFILQPDCGGAGDSVMLVARVPCHPSHDPQSMASDTRPYVTSGLGQEPGMDSLPPALRQGVEEFNRAYFFEAHDTLEELWRETSGPLRPFYQGLIQLAVALYHLSNGNRRGALNLLGKGLDKLAPFQPACQRIDVDALCHEARSWLDRVRQAGDGELTVDPAQLPRIRWLTSERNSV